jgi:hypothetical protein
LIVLASLAAIGQPPANAAEPTKPTLAFNGYGTLGIVHSSEGRADFIGGSLLKRGAGHSSSWSAEVDSRLGAQLEATFNAKLAAVVQVIAEQQADGTYTPHLEWANVSYQLTSHALVRLGRTVSPTFMISDYRKVGYVNPWVRPPPEVYGMNPITTSDGVDAVYDLRLGDYATTFQASYGQVDVKLRDGLVKARNSWGVRALVERGAGKVHLSFHQAEVAIDRFNTLFDAFRQFGPQGVALAERYDADGRNVQFASTGVSYDPGRWFVMGEWANFRSHSAAGDRTGWYVSAGIRRGALAPYMTYAESSADSNRSDAGLAAAAYPEASAPTIAGLNGALNVILGALPVQRTVSIGARWDFRANFDLKIQLDHTRLGRGSSGELVNLQPGFRPGGDFDLISCALDFVF